jgi:chromosome segregation ATPase
MTNNSTEVLFCNHPTTQTGDMNQEHDTPRTDAELNKTWKGIHAAFVPMSFSKQLERELNASHEAYLQSVERDDYLTQALAASQAEVEELQQQKRNCIEILDDDAIEIAELKAEVERLELNNTTPPAPSQVWPEISRLREKIAELQRELVSKSDELESVHKRLKNYTNAIETL